MKHNLKTITIAYLIAVLITTCVVGVIAWNPLWFLVEGEKTTVVRFIVLIVAFIFTVCVVTEPDEFEEEQ